MNYIFTLSTCLLTSVNLFSIDLGSDTTMILNDHSDQLIHHESDHFISIIIYDLAAFQLSLKNSDFKKAYEHSQKALTATIILNQNSTERLDLLFLSLFSHIVSCDQLGLLNESFYHLDELKSLSRLFEVEHETFNYEMIAFENFCAPLNQINEEIIKEDLIKISEKFQNKNHNTLENSFKKSQQSINSPQAKKIWKRSWNWWKKQINETCDAIKKILECLDLIEERANQHKNRN